MWSWVMCGGDGGTRLHKVPRAGGVLAPDWRAKSEGVGAGWVGEGREDVSVGVTDGWSSLLARKSIMKPGLIWRPIYHIYLLPS